MSSNFSSRSVRTAAAHDTKLEMLATSRKENKTKGTSFVEAYL
jgi:hypothetical protein